MKYPYSEALSPPAPVLPIEVFIPEEPQQRRSLDAKLDTAADISAVPSALIDDLKLEAVSEIVISGYDAKSELMATYTVGLELPRARVRHIEVIAVPDAYILLGRDVLNHFDLHLNGPELSFEMDLPHAIP